ncbi:MAG: cytochrome c [Acidobacteriota bacterium]|nr:cytochrome c [Acidobacteriota bacterium]
MTPIKLTIIICVLTILSAACARTVENNRTANGNFQTAISPSATTPTPAPTVEFAAAQATFNATCVNCHKQNGEGGIADLGGGEKLEVPSFKTGQRLTDTDEDFARQIANGGEGMPAFGKRLTPAQIDELVRYVRHEFQQGLVKDSSATQKSGH